MEKEYILTFHPVIGGGHNPSAAIFIDGELAFAAEEERYTRKKEARNQFPENAINACLSHCEIELNDVKKVVITRDPSLSSKKLDHRLKRSILYSPGIVEKLFHTERVLEKAVRMKIRPLNNVREKLKEVGSSIPPIETRPHHYCHAASAFYPSGFDEALIITMDASGEFDSTVIWEGSQTGLERIHTYEYPNSLGRFYGVITEYLGYHRSKGAGKIMGLAPYGNHNDDIMSKINNLIDTGYLYDVTEITEYGTEYGVSKLEEVFGRPRNDSTEDFSQWQKDLAFAAQKCLEDTVTNLVGSYTELLDTKHVCFAGGVALNCKMNKVVIESEDVDELFVQPVANDAGNALGAGYAESSPSSTNRLTNVYYGDEFKNSYIEDFLKNNKINYEKPDELESGIASEIANGRIVGWFNNRMEMGPRALGNRSILADPRSSESRDRVNKYVKHREEWRPFAPSILKEKAEEYLQNYDKSGDAPFMIKTFDVYNEKKSEIPAVLHPADGTTRPQVVSESENPDYYNLISEFENVTDVPVLLNTSFNDHGEPIVRSPREAVRSFYSMGIDTLVLNDIVVRKEGISDK
jgi:carbamoyltransferase